MTGDKKIEIKLPDLTASSEKAIVTFWHAKENSAVTKEQDLVEVVTDKASFCITAPCDGKILSIFKKVGDEVDFGEKIAEITV
ncbi:MAG: lipoyl domain-containing protein [Candidatus Omnitrophota bacterium]|nr:lipoyl domain-containing protein [Candidatus Omnitrophota bacterium]